MQLKSLITIAQNIIKIQPVWCSTYGTEDLNPHSIFVDRVTYCALCTGISCRYLAVALVTWGRALGPGSKLGSIGHQGKKQGNQLLKASFPRPSSRSHWGYFHTIRQNYLISNVKYHYQYMTSRISCVNTAHALQIWFWTLHSWFSILRN